MKYEIEATKLDRMTVVGNSEDPQVIAKQFQQNFPDWRIESVAEVLAEDDETVTEYGDVFEPMANCESCGKFIWAGTDYGYDDETDCHTCQECVVRLTTPTEAAKPN